MVFLPLLEGCRLGGKRLLYAVLRRFLAGINLGLELWCFIGGFGEKRVVNVVILWRVCGGMCGKRGHMADTFEEQKIGHQIQVYFDSAPTGPALRPYLRRLRRDFRLPVRLPVPRCLSVCRAGRLDSPLLESSG